jgi:predicted RNA-binding protein (virulence factor B family)
MIVTQRQIGYLKYYDIKNESGFVALLDGSHQEIYTHKRFFEEEIKEGDKVVFYIKENKSGWIAVRLKKT